MKLINQLSSVLARSFLHQEEARKERLFLARLIVVAFVAAILVRVLPGKDHFIWDWDQARDSYVSAAVVRTRDLVLVGPQAQIFGMFHGPLTYYLLGPAYFLAEGSPQLALWVMILLNASVVVPLVLLSYSLFKDRSISFLVAVFFVVAYEQVEYARWISNVSVALPFLAWSYYLVWEIVQRQQVPHQLSHHLFQRWLPLAAGLVFGLAVQGQIFLLYLIPWYLLAFYLTNQKISTWFGFGIGSFVSLFPQLLFEIKYGFQGMRIFFEQYLVQKSGEVVPASEVFLDYITHLSMVTKHTIAGFSDGLGLWFLVAMFLVLAWRWSGLLPAHKKAALYCMMILVSHSLTFAFQYVDEIFLDLGIGYAVILLAALVIRELWQVRLSLAAVGIGLFIVFSQAMLLYKNTLSMTPFSHYHVIQSDLLFSQKLDVVAKVYELAQGKPFSLGVLGSPYGVRTKWASVFAEYNRRTGTVAPPWFGYVAHGYPGELYFTPQDYPEEKHFVLIESNPNLHSPTIRQQYLEDLDRTTILIATEKIHDTTIQIRAPRLEK